MLRAQDLNYKDEDRINNALPEEYYSKLAQRVKLMANGTLPPYGRWISGYYFNSALLRLGARFESPAIGRNVSFDQAVESLCELVTVLNGRKDQLADSCTKFPGWKASRNAAPRN